MFALLAAGLILAGSSSGQDKPKPRDPDAGVPAPPPLIKEKKDEKKKKEKTRIGFLKIGTRKGEVDELLGTPVVGSDIPMLRRVKNIYRDGTEVLFFDDQAISASPGYKGQQTADGRILIEREKVHVFIDPALLPTCGHPPLTPDLKCRMEMEYDYALPPPAPPSGLGGPGGCASCQSMNGVPMSAIPTEGGPVLETPPGEFLPGSVPESDSGALPLPRSTWQRMRERSNKVVEQMRHLVPGRREQ